MILNIGGGGGVKPRIVVTAPTGSDVTVSKGTTILYAPEVSGTWTFNVPEQGDWSATAILGSKTASKVVSVGKVGVYNVTLRYVSTTLNDNSWEDIKGVADASEGQNYWAVGDTKQITINGKLSDGLTLSNYSTYVYIIGFDHNSAVEGTGMAFQGFKTAQTGGVDVALCDSGYNSSKASGLWFNMNNNNSTSGGWESCNMRNNTLPMVKSTMPSDLQSVLKITTIYTDNTGGSSTAASYVTATKDDLYLLAEFEIFGARTYANTAEQNFQKQYAYYVSGNSKVKYRHDSTATAANWLERSVYAATVHSFCGVNTGGAAAFRDANFSYGLAPCFKVGTTPIFPTLNDNSWDAIAKVAYTSEGANYWSVGDTKEIIINGKLSDGLTLSNYKTWVYILGFDHNEAVEGKGIVFGGFKTAQTGGVDVALRDNSYGSQETSGIYFNMNGINVNRRTENTGGWSICNIRSFIIPLLRKTLSSDLLSVIRPSAIYTDNTGGGTDTASNVTITYDDVYLPSEYEIFGTRTYANSAEQTLQEQYAYYVSGNSKIKKAHSYPTDSVSWWERSVDSRYNSTYCLVNMVGEEAYATSMQTCYGFAPVFRVCYMPQVSAGELPVGSTVRINESGSVADYIIIQQGNPDATKYDSSCDGTWLLRREIYDMRTWTSSADGKYASSTMNTWLNSGFLNGLGIKNIIKEVKIPYRTDCTSSGENKYLSDGLSTKCFLLSAKELGFSSDQMTDDGTAFAYFDSNSKRMAIYSTYGYTANWWTRSPRVYGTIYREAFTVYMNGGYANSTTNIDSYGSRPCFIIPSDTLVDSSGNIVID